MVSPNNNGDYYCRISFDNNANWTQLWSEEDAGYFNWSFYKTKVIDISEYERIFQRTGSLSTIEF